MTRKKKLKLPQAPPVIGSQPKTGSCLLSGDNMGRIKAKSTKKGGTLDKVVKTGKKLIRGGGDGGGGKRRRGVQWYANAVLKEKLKKKLFRIKYGGGK